MMLAEMARESEEIMTYRVNLWGSKPGQNDDCWMGEEFASLQGAREAYEDPEGFFNHPGWHRDHQPMTGTKWVELDGPGVHEERRVRSEDCSDDDEWRNERARQAGMAFGVAGYNDAY